MEEAPLHGDTINIEAKRLELESESNGRDDIINQLKNDTGHSQRKKHLPAVVAMNLST